MSNLKQPFKIITELPEISIRKPESHKGTYGKLLIVAGSRGMTGAAVLCGSAALRGGAGLVRVAVPESVLPIVACGNPCYTTVGLPQEPDGHLSLIAEERILELAQDNDVLALGPGLGQSTELHKLLALVVQNIAIPAVIDADGLNNLGTQPGCLKKRDKPLILTPHPGEFSRLLGMDMKTVQANRTDLAAEFARENNVIVVLKGHGTIVTDGEWLYRNTTGNPGMATGGTGDVLTGLIAALLGQGLEPFAAAQLGVHVHGLAGDLARKDLGEISLIASDLLDYLPRAFASL